MALNSNELQEIRSILTEHLPWSPLDFIRKLPADRDRNLFAKQLTEELDAEDDFRTVGTIASGQRVAVFAERLAWDTAFFGYGVARINGVFLLDTPFHQTCESYADVLRPLLADAENNGVKYVFAVVEPRDLALLRSLGELGFSLIETKLYYHMELLGYQPSDRFPVRAATEDDIDTLGAAATIMTNEFDRFHADPYIKRQDADRLMHRWVEASIREGFADITIVPDRKNPSAFCTVRYHKDKWPLWTLNVSQPVFSAVSIDARGWYRKLISEINCHLRDLGAVHSYLSTQLTNKAVLRVWESLGYRLGKGAHVLRRVL